MRIAASTLLALRSFILASAISRTCPREILPAARLAGLLGTRLQIWQAFLRK